MAFYPQGIFQLSQTVFVVAVGLLIVVVPARQAYPRRSWLWRTVLLVLMFALLGAADLWLNEGAGGPYDYHGVGTSLHYGVLLVAIATTLGIGVATVRAHRKAQPRRSATGTAGATAR